MSGMGGIASTTPSLYDRLLAIRKTLQEAHSVLAEIHSKVSGPFPTGSDEKMAEPNCLNGLVSAINAQAQMLGKSLAELSSQL